MACWWIYISRELTVQFPLISLANSWMIKTSQFVQRHQFSYVTVQWFLLSNSRWCEELLWSLRRKINCVQFCFCGTSWKRLLNRSRWSVIIPVYFPFSKLHTRDRGTSIKPWAASDVSLVTDHIYYYIVDTDVYAFSSTSIFRAFTVSLDISTNVHWIKLL